MLVEKRVIELPERIRPFLRAMWFFWATLFLAIIVLNVPAQVNIIAEILRGNVTETAVNIATVLAQVAGSFISLTLAGVLYFKRPKEGMALFLSYFLLVIGVVSMRIHFLGSIWPDSDTFIYGVIQPLIFGPFLIAFLSTFPNGRFIPTWTRWLVIVAILYAPVGPFIFTAEAYAEPTLIYTAGVLFWFVFIFSAIYAQIYRYRHVSNPEEKQQIKWVVYAFALAGLFVFFSTIWTIVSNSQSPETPESWWSSFIGLGWILAYSALPISLTIAVMRYRLYDIDIIINRTLLYGVLTAVIVILYVLIVGGAGLVIQTNANLAGVLITVVLIIIIFRPLRAICQQGVDRLLYGATGMPLVGPSGEQPSQQEPTVTDITPTALAPPKWLRVARLAWYPTAVFAFAIFLAAIPGYFILGSAGIIDPRFSASPSPLISTVLRVVIVVALLTSLTSLLLAVLLFRRRADDHMALLTSFVLLAYGVIMSGSLEALEPFIPGIATFTITVLIPLFQPFILLLFAVFPDGRFVPSWTKWVIVAIFLIIPFTLIWTTQLTQSSLDFSQPRVVIIIGINILLFVAIIAIILHAQIYRYRRVSTLLQKQQTKWVLYGVILWFTIQFLSGLPWVYTYTLPSGTPYPAWLAVMTPIWLFSVVSIPLTLTIAIMRYRLFEIDFLINRSLMYGTLTLVVVTIYVLVVGALGLFFQAQDNLIVALLATGVVAALFQPLRERLQHGVNRLIYGERDDPIEVLSQLGKSLETALPTDQVLLTLVETIAQTLKLPFVGITLHHHESDRLAAQFGTPVADPVEFSLTFQGETTGHLLVASRSHEARFTAAEMRLLRNIARQAGATVHNVQLTADLQRSRQRLVTTREEERRRLRRDLHDGLGATLAALNLEAAVLRRSIRNNPDKAEILVDRLRNDIRATIDDIRHLVYELRPPTLDQLGLVEAVRAQAAHYGQSEIQEGAAPNSILQVQVEAPETMPPLPAAVEVAAYRIAQEALTNVVHHAQAQHCTIRLQIGADLSVEIIDDGVGLNKNHASHHGLGLLSMRERAEELGGRCVIEPTATGGTRVLASLPLLEV